MYLYLLLVVDKSQHVVARNGMTAVHELILCYIVVGDKDGLLAVELVGHHEQRLFLLIFVLLYLGIVHEERHESPPSSAGVLLLLPAEYVDLSLSEDDSFFSYGLEEVLAFRDVVECGELVGG